MPTETLYESLSYRDKAHRMFRRFCNYEPALKAGIIVLLLSCVSIVTAIPSAVIASLYLLRYKRYRVSFAEKDNLLITLFVVMIFVVALIFGNWMGAIAAAVLLISLILVFGIRQSITERAYEDMIVVFVGYSAVAFVVAAVEYIIMRQGDPMYRCSSTFINPLYYSLFAVFAALMCVYRISTVSGSRAVYIVLLLMNMGGIFLSGSRMPWVGLFVGVLLMLFVMRKYRLFFIFLICTAAITAFAMIFQGAGMLEALRLDDIGKSYNGRIKYWKYALEGLLDRPLFGCGLLGILNNTIAANHALQAGTFNIFDMTQYFAAVKSGGAMMHAHNIVLDALYNFGILGSLTLVICVFNRCFKMYTATGSTDDPLFGLLAGGFAALFVCGMVDCEIIGGQTAVFTLILFTITSIKKSKPTEPTESAVRGQRL